MAVIITDSTSDLSLEQANNFGIEMISLKVRFGDTEYLDKRTISTEQFYEKLAQCDELPTTTLISVGEFIDAYEKYPNDDIVVLSISSKLSGTYQSAMTAKQLSHRENIYVVDTMCVTAGLALLVEQAVELNKRGKTAKEIAGEVTQLAPRVRLIAAFDTLKNLVKGGRLSSVSGAVGTVLGIKPIIAIEDGIVKNIGKARGMKAAMNELIKILETDRVIDKTMPVLFGHTDNLTDLNTFIDMLGYNHAEVLTVGSVVGTHAGIGAITMAYFVK